MFSRLGSDIQAEIGLSSPSNPIKEKSMSNNHKWLKCHGNANSLFRWRGNSSKGLLDFLSTFRWIVPCLWFRRPRIWWILWCPPWRPPTWPPPSTRSLKECKTSTCPPSPGRWKLLRKSPWSNARSKMTVRPTKWSGPLKRSSSTLCRPWASSKQWIVFKRPLPHSRRLCFRSRLSLKIHQI